MTLALLKIAPVGVFAEKLKDGHYHYGLLFHVPSRVSLPEVQKLSRLKTRSRHGTVQQWSLCRPIANMLPGHYVLLIPRSWLILNGFLSPTIVLMRQRRAPFWLRERLMQNFWLEWPESEGLLLQQAA